MISSAFKLFAIVDLYDVLCIKQLNERGLLVKKIEFETVLSSYNGISFFMIFKNNPDFLDLI